MPEIFSDKQFRIIEAAGKILTASGIGGLRIKSIAQEMQFSESAVYRHFKSKEDIIVAMLTFLAESMEERFAKAIENESDPLEKFKAISRNQFNFFKKNPHFVAAVFSDGLMKESDRVNDAILKIMGVKKKYLQAIIEEGIQKKVFTNAIPIEDLIHVVIATFRLKMYKWRVANFEFDILKNGEELMKSILILIKKQ